MMIHRRALIAVAAMLALAGLAAPAAAAQDRAQAAARFIEDLGTRAIDALVKPSISRGEAQERFAGLLNQGFDVPYIGRFVLGRNWNAATPEQQREYLQLFERLIVQVYADRFTQYSGQQLDVEENLKILGARNEGDNDAVVSTQIIRPDAPPVAVDWRVRQRGAKMQIIDVAVEGVSMSVTQRNEFASVIQRGGGRMEALLQALRQRVGQS